MANVVKKLSISFELAQKMVAKAVAKATELGVSENVVILDDGAVDGLNATEAVPFDDVYAVGFYGHGVLYDIGNGIARAIVENDGPQGLAAFLKQAPYTFALRYTQLPKYGADKDHPKLGPNTVNALNQSASGCK